MGLFGSSATTTSTTTVNSRILRALEHARDHRVTGRILVTDLEADQAAAIFTFEGEVYAVALDGYEPRVSARLASGARVTPEQRAALEATHDAGGPARSGALAVAQGWVTAEVLAAVHQEFVVAAFGAVVCREHVRVHAEDGVTTEVVCALPLPLDALVATVEPRATRRAADERQITPDDLGSAIVGRTSLQPPGALALPEVGALLDALDGVHPVDVVAGDLGFTRAEVAHLLAALVASGSVAVVGQATAAGRWTVPEQFGDRSVVPGGASATPAPVAAEVAPEPELPPEPILDVEPELPPEPILDAEPELPSEPELRTEPDPAPAPGPESSSSEPPIGDFATAALRAELAAAEHWAAELRARLEREQQRRPES